MMNDDGNVLNVQVKGSKPSHGFATRLGRGLDIGTLNQSSRPECTREAVRCPPVLELRQLLQYQPVTQQTRAKLVAVAHYSKQRKIHEILAGCDHVAVFTE